MNNVADIIARVDKTLTAMAAAERVVAAGGYISEQEGRAIAERYKALFDNYTGIEKSYFWVMSDLALKNPDVIELVANFHYTCECQHLVPGHQLLSNESTQKFALLFEKLILDLQSLSVAEAATTVATLLELRRIHEIFGPVAGSLEVAGAEHCRAGHCNFIGMPVLSHLSVENRLGFVTLHATPEFVSALKVST